MADLEVLLGASNIILVAPFIFVLLFTLIFKSVSASHFFVNSSRVLYPLILAFICFYYFEEPGIPPQSFYHAVMLAFACLVVLFFFGKKFRYIIQLLLFNAMIYFLFNNQVNVNPIFSVGVGAVLNVAFALLYGVAIGKKNIVIKFAHAAILLALAYWAFILNQNNLFYIAVLCSASIVTVSLLKVVFLGGVVPNFSRPLIDVGIPLLLLWQLINTSGIFFDLLSPYTNIETFLN